MTAVDLSLPEHPSILRRLVVGLRALRVLDTNAGDPVAGPAFNAALEREAFGRLIPRLRAIDDGRQILDERPSLSAAELDLHALARLPVGTLGQALASYYQANAISPFETTFAVHDDIDYLSKRYRETHDSFHVITGYATDVIGEMELQAFVMGNLGLKGPAMILAWSAVALALGVGTSGDVGKVDWGNYQACVRAAWRAGKASPPLLALPVEANWETPVTVLRARLCPTANPVGNAGVAVMAA